MSGDGSIRVSVILPCATESRSSATSVFMDSDDEAQEGYVQMMSEALEKFDVVGAYSDTKTLNPWCARQQMASNEGIPFYWNTERNCPGASSPCVRLCAKATSRA